MKFWMRGFLIFCFSLITLFLPWSQFNNGIFWQPANLLQTLSVGNGVLIFSGIVFLMGTALTFWTTVGGFLQVIGSMGFMVTAKPDIFSIGGASGVVTMPAGVFLGFVVGWVWIYYFMRYRVIEVVPAEDHLWVRLVDNAGKRLFWEDIEDDSMKDQEPVSVHGGESSGPSA